MAFCKEYNAATQDKVGTVIPVEITVFEVSPDFASVSVCSYCGCCCCCINIHHVFLPQQATILLVPCVS